MGDRPLVFGRVFSCLLRLLDCLNEKVQSHTLVTFLQLFPAFPSFPLWPATSLCPLQLNWRFDTVCKIDSTIPSTYRRETSLNLPFWNHSPALLKAKRSNRVKVWQPYTKCTTIWTIHFLGTLRPQKKELLIIFLGQELSAGNLTNTRCFTIVVGP